MQRNAKECPAWSRVGHRVLLLTLLLLALAGTGSGPVRTVAAAPAAPIPQLHMKEARGSTLEYYMDVRGGTATPPSDFVYPSLPSDTPQKRQRATSVDVWTKEMNDFAANMLQKYATGLDSKVLSWDACSADWPYPSPANAQNYAKSCVKAYLRVSTVAECRTVSPLCCPTYWLTPETTPLMKFADVPPELFFWDGAKAMNGYYVNFTPKYIEEHGKDCWRLPLPGKVTDGVVLLAMDTQGEWRYTSDITQYALRQVNLTEAEALGLSGATDAAMLTLGQNPEDHLPLKGWRNMSELNTGGVVTVLVVFVVVSCLALVLLSAVDCLKLFPNSCWFTWALCGGPALDKTTLREDEDEYAKHNNAARESYIRAASMRYAPDDGMDPVEEKTTSVASGAGGNARGGPSGGGINPFQSGHGGFPPQMMQQPASVYGSQMDRGHQSATGSMFQTPYNQQQQYPRQSQNPVETTDVMPLNASGQQQHGSDGVQW